MKVMTDQQSYTKHFPIVIRFQVFLSNTNNYIVSIDYSFLVIVICFPRTYFVLAEFYLSAMAYSQHILSFKGLIIFPEKTLIDLSVLVGRVFTNGPGDLGSIPGRVIPKTLKMVLDTSLLNTQLCKVRIKGKVGKFRERSSALPYTSGK